VISSSGQLDACAWQPPLACAFPHLRAKVASQPLSLLVLTALPASCAAANVFSLQRTFRAPPS
jgi:hypothetical protein